MPKHKGQACGNFSGIHKCFRCSGSRLVNVAIARVDTILETIRVVELTEALAGPYCAIAADSAT
jgi:crotonobetainyl-CoA:carnitine CoA-transferase CaiB-like acyl-CoA transferase